MVYVSEITLSSGKIVMAVEAFNVKDATKALTSLFPENKKIELTTLKKFLENGVTVSSKGIPLGKSIVAKAQYELNK